MQYKVTLYITIWKVKGAVCNAYEKEVTLPFPPFTGLEIDGMSIRLVSYESEFKSVTCYMLPVDALGINEVFEGYCRDYLRDGWIRA